MNGVRAMSVKQSVLVVGGAGYIGSHCCKALAEAGFEPVCYDNLSTGHANFVQWGPLVEGDLHDTSKIASVLRKHEALAVMHFAAFSAVGESVADPQKYYVNNIGGTLALLSAMNEAGCRSLVFSSTGAVYGDAGRDPIRETDAGRPVNPYGRSKWMIEQILSDYRSAYRLNSICLRYFNACGADAACTIGELRDSETHLIPRALMALQGYVPDFAIFGEDYETPDGTAIRDYIHVSDLAEAHVVALNRLLSGEPGGAFNLGTGIGYSVKQILEAVLTETGKAVPVTIRERRAGDPSILVADVTRSEGVLGFKASRSDIGNIVRSAWAWHQKAHPVRVNSVAGT